MMKSPAESIRGPGTSAPSPDAEPLAGFALACPTCGRPIVPKDGAVGCGNCDTAFSLRAGVWRFLPASREARFAGLLREYRTVRKAEGWGSQDAEYYRALPRVSASDPNAGVWKIRAKSFQTLIDRVICPLEATLGRPLKILDLGAGNCWLSYRLAQRGHAVAAVDLSDDREDGLGAYVWYQPEPTRDSRDGCALPESKGGRFTPIQAEFDRLPFAHHQVDLVVFNASLHYSIDYRTTLGEALRVLRTDGLIVVLDSPNYRNSVSGAQMVLEREAAFQRQHGFTSAFPTESYLASARLSELARSLGLRWRTIDSVPGWRSWLRSWKARWRGQREPARFPVIVGQWAPPSLRSGHGAAVRGLWRILLRLRFRLVQRHRYDRLVLETVLGQPILVLPQVFNPKLLRTGEFLVQALDEMLIPKGSTVLDLGTGSGVGAVFAARWARSVIAVDVNPAAVRCARINLLLNQVDDHVAVRLGDLFAPVRGESFDVVLFNPPYFRGQPSSRLDQAWRATDIVERFAAGLGDHLTANGHALIVLSSDGEAAAFLRELRERGMAIDVVANRDLINETLTVYRVWKARR